MGCTHAQVGAYLMSIWGLPVPLVHAVAFHDSPSDTKETQFSALTAVHVADAIVSATDPSTLNHDIEMDLCYLDRLGLREREAVWRSLHEKHMAAKGKG
jgi:HD-like signal output (HDOD) protein